jgi:hypothetical protein
MSLKHDARRVHELVDRIKPILAGEAPNVQGAVLADLLAMWLAGHVIMGDPKETEKMRERALEIHIATVRALIPIEYETRIEPEIRRRQQ